MRARQIETGDICAGGVLEGAASRSIRSAVANSKRGGRTRPTPPNPAQGFMYTFLYDPSGQAALQYQQQRQHQQQQQQQHHEEAQQLQQLQHHDDAAAGGAATAAAVPAGTNDVAGMPAA